MININTLLANYELIQPEWLWLIPLYISALIVIPKFAIKYFIKNECASLVSTYENKKTLFHPLIKLLSRNNGIIKKKTSIPFLYSVLYFLLVAALTQPVHIGKKLPDPPRQRDIIFIVDTSVSMILRDYILNGERIDRMSLLKSILDKFIRKLKGERMSIIVFGDNAYTLVPLTSDQILLRKMLSRVQATMAGRFNAIGDAIALAVKQASKTNKETDSKAKRKRVLVLLTDADQPTSKIDPVVAAQLAKKENLPLYTIAIGASSLAAEEKRQGGLLYSPVDLELLNRLSAATGAKSFQAGNPNALEKAIDAINLHESNTRKFKPVYYREALYYWFLIAAAILISFTQLFNLLKSVTFNGSKK